MLTYADAFAAAEVGLCAPFADICRRMQTYADTFVAAEVGLCAPFTEKDPLLEEFEELPLPRPPYSPVAPAAGVD